MFLRRRQFFTQNKYFFGLGALLLATFYCEWLVFVIQPQFWAELKCGQDEQCTKILFIADPQIQGEMAAPSPLNHLFIYDSDRYVKTTFSAVTKHFQPDVLVFLGDIMDEGSVATEEQYERYVKRIRDIFPSTGQYDEVWVPGDNDIGGEMEPISKDKIDAFERAYQNSSAVASKNILFYKVNAITNTLPKLENITTDSYKIVVSHYPVTLKYNLRTQVVNKINPNIFFCAHLHESKFVVNSKDFSIRNTYKLQSGKNLHEKTNMCEVNGQICLGMEILEVHPSNDSLYEIYVPTCSYRMGTSKIGYGAAVYEHKNQILKYTVFWSPQRFPYLAFYLVLLMIPTMWMVFYGAKWLGYQCQLKYSNNSLWSGKDSNLLLKKNSPFTKFTDTKAY